jgi:glycosyltransferase involved in cell wall biosynthesis
MIGLAIVLAVIAACCFAASVAMQHGAVRDTDNGAKLSLRTLSRVIRSRRWLIGTGLAVFGTALHVIALSMAPLVIVQPIGVLSLVLTVLIGARANGLAVVAVCVGTAGFVLIAASTGADTAGVAPGSTQLLVIGALLLSGIALLVRGRLRCLSLAVSAAVLFGLGSALIRAATQDFTVVLALESALLILAGGWLVHQAYAAGSPAVVIASTTVIDPFTGVAVGLWLYGESAQTTPVQAVALAAFALLSAGGVLALAKDPTPAQEEPPMAHNSGLRILIGADTFPPNINGAANFAGRLAHGLAARGHDVHVAAPAPVPSDSEITVHPITSNRTPFHPTFRISLPWRAAREAEALVQRLKPDVVHVQSHFPVGRAILRAAHRHGIPVIATNHFMPENLLGYVPIPRGMRAAAVRWAWRDLVKIFSTAELVTAPTPRAVELLSANGLPGSPRAISCGIDLDHYPMKETHGRAVLFVGRLDEEKNVDELIRAVSLLPDVRAEIVGDGSCRAQLEALAESLQVTDRVTFHGFVSDAELVQAYQRCDLFCMPGTAELQSLATMEAMAAGLPVVAADAMALPHLVHPGVNGFRFPPGNVAILAAAISEVFRNPGTAAAMGRASRQMIAAHDIDRTLEEFESVYIKAIGGPALVNSKPLSGSLAAT